MKKTRIAVAFGSIALLSAHGVAQDSLFTIDQAFFANNNIGLSGGPIVKVSQLQDEIIYELGGMLAATITQHKHSFSIGASAFTMTNDIPWANNTLLDKTYAGILLGYAYQPKALLHFNTNLLLGFGEVAIVPKAMPEGAETTSDFLVAELGAQVDLRVLPFADLGLGSSYRLTTDPGIENLTVGDLSKPSIFVSLTFNTP